MMRRREATGGHPAVLAVLSARRHRVTQQRRDIIAECARMGRYATAQELHERLRARKMSIGLATVYRTLEMLREVGAASTQVQAKGEAAYLFCPIAHHHHAVCVKCGQVADVACRRVMRFERELPAELRFRLTQHRMEFFGTCARCS